MGEARFSFALRLDGAPERWETSKSLRVSVISELAMKLQEPRLTLCR